jgi:transcriptional regulator with XRE-family HTH domain
VPKGFRVLVKERMKQQGVSLRQVAAQADMSPAYLCRLLLGERGLPPDDAPILKLAEALGIEPPELLLIKANRVPKGLEGGVPLLLSAYEAPNRAEFYQAMKQLQAFILSQKQKGKRK